LTQITCAPARKAAAQQAVYSGGVHPYFGTN